MIGNLTKKAIIDGVTENIDKWMDAIGVAYVRAGDGLKVSLPVDLTPKNGSVEVKVGISFTESKVKDENVRVVDEKQIPLGFGDGIDSMTITGAGKTVTLNKDGIKRLDKKLPATEGRE